jgi:DNA polymerase-3 subunit epsilon
MREIVFDTETTGIDSKGDDRIVEIGCVELIGLNPTGRTFHAYLNPERDVPDEVVKVHGLSGAFLRDKPVFAAVADAFLAFIDESPLIAHNAEFDRGFINAELQRLGRPALPPERFIDTLAMAREKFRGANNRLDALAKRFRLDRAGFDLAARKGAGGHGALLDSRMLAEIYLQLKGGREQALDLGDRAPDGQGPDGSGQPLQPRAPRPPRPAPLKPLITAEEEQAHEAYIAKMKTPSLWLKFKDS